MKMLFCPPPPIEPRLSQHWHSVQTVWSWSAETGRGRGGRRGGSGTIYFFVVCFALDATSLVPLRNTKISNNWPSLFVLQEDDDQEEDDDDDEDSDDDVDTDPLIAELENENGGEDEDDEEEDDGNDEFSPSDEEVARLLEEDVDAADDDDDDDDDDEDDDDNDEDDSDNDDVDLDGDNGEQRVYSLPYSSGYSNFLHFIDSKPVCL